MIRQRVLNPDDSSLFGFPSNPEKLPWWHFSYSEKRDSKRAEQKTTYCRLRETISSRIVSRKGNSFRHSLAFLANRSVLNCREQYGTNSNCSLFMRTASFAASFPFLESVSLIPVNRFGRLIPLSFQSLKNAACFRSNGSGRVRSSRPKDCFSRT